MRDRRAALAAVPRCSIHGGCLRQAGTAKSGGSACSRGASPGLIPSPAGSAIQAAWLGRSPRLSPLQRAAALHCLHAALLPGCCTLVMPRRGPPPPTPPHPAHRRSTIIGDTIARALEFCGADVLRLNHIVSDRWAEGAAPEHIVRKSIGSGGCAHTSTVPQRRPRGRHFLLHSPTRLGQPGRQPRRPASPRCSALSSHWACYTCNRLTPEQIHCLCGRATGAPSLAC